MYSTEVHGFFRPRILVSETMLAFHGNRMQRSMKPLDPMMSPTPFALLICLAMQSCAPQGKTTQEAAPPGGATDDITLLTATGQKWTAGIIGDGSGTEYTFTVAIAGTGPVLFDSVDVSGATYKPALIKRGSPVTNEPVVPQQGDTLDLRISVRDAEPPAPKEPTTGSPQAVLRFTVNGKPARLEVARIEMLAPRPRP